MDHDKIAKEAVDECEKRWPDFHNVSPAIQVAALWTVVQNKHKEIKNNV